jgi:hypothetical protein
VKQQSGLSSDKHQSKLAYKLLISKRNVKILIIISQLNSSSISQFLRVRTALRNVPQQRKRQRQKFLIAWSWSKSTVRIRNPKPRCAPRREAYYYINEGRFGRSPVRGLNQGWLARARGDFFMRKYFQRNLNDSS